jgi:hypothetical protein
MPNAPEDASPPRRMIPNKSQIQISMNKTFCTKNKNSALYKIDTLNIAINGKMKV